MFTGIITDIGHVLWVKEQPSSRTFRMASAYEVETIAIGASIAHDGCCLTVTAKGRDRDINWYEVDVSPHTLAHTTLGGWQVGQRVNLERALRAGDELGGHIVSGHVDGVAEILHVSDEGNARHYTILAPEKLAMYIAEKGAVTLDGTSLTVTWVKGREFGLTLIPHTLQVTTWGAKKAGDKLNLEIDILARYLRRITEYTV